MVERRWDIETAMDECRQVIVKKHTKPLLLNHSG